MDSYYISEHCRYLKGKQCLAIYDLKNNEIYSLNHDATFIIDNALIHNVLDDSTYLLTELCAKKLLNSSEFSEFKIACNVEEKINYVWLELTGRCNCTCLHCYGAFGYPSAHIIRNELSTDNWKDILLQIKELGGINSIYWW